MSDTRYAPPPGPDAPAGPGDANTTPVPDAPDAPGTGFAGQLRRTLEPLPDDAGAADVWRALGRGGITAALYASGHPDGPVDLDRLGTLLSALDARGDNGVTLSVLVQTASALPLLANAPGERCATARARVLAGDARVALAATDEGAPGSDLTALTTRVAVRGGQLALDGGKRWITNALGAGYLLVLARQRPGRHFTGFSWVLVPADTPGVTVTPADTSLLARSGTGHLRFDGVQLAPDHMVGRPGRALADFARHMATERIAGAYWAVALTSRVLHATQDRLAHRVADGRTLWQNPVVRRDFAACLVRVTQLRALLDTVTQRVTADRDLAWAGLLKAAVGLEADTVLSRCAELQGADGMAAGGAHRIRAEAAVLGIGGGATDLMLAQVADRAETFLDRLGARP
ncbi:acyl-CoA dehydrogenase family protein [Streptomyces shenzhenensis]|uniref:acyl-CoA dehydrogenase family protein n=1 Tax=Streptomyces shenzhenensis TaxID=943815 RepID=UPI00380A2741